MLQFTLKSLKNTVNSTIVMDVIMKEEESEARLELLFADHLAIVETSEKRIEDKLRLWQRKLDINKTKDDQG